MVVVAARADVRWDMVTSAPMDGRLIGGRYRLLESHATGGSASVWRALDESTGEIVAVKRLHPHLIDDEVARTRLEREAAALRSLHHPNVVGVRTLVDDPAEPAFVMDFVPGRTLAERLTADGPLIERDALAVAASVADALAAAHARSIVHRDVKPANVLLGDDGRIRLADFGIAADGEDPAALTDADGVVGTLRYLAPERLTGSAATVASDVWALGALLAEAVSGVAIAAATTVAERVATAGRKPVRSAGMSDETWRIARRALAVDPGRRYPDAASMALDLHAAAGTLPDVADPPEVDPWAATAVISLPALATSTEADDARVNEAAVAMAAPTEPEAEPAPGIEAPEPTHEPAPAVVRATAWGPALRAGSTQGRPPRPSTGLLTAVVGAGVLALLVMIGVAGTGSRSAAGPGASAPSAAQASSVPAPSATARPAPKVTPAVTPKAAGDEKGKGNGKGKGKGKGD